MDVRVVKRLDGRENKENSLASRRTSSAVAAD